MLRNPLGRGLYHRFVDGETGLARPARRLGCCNSESQVNPLPSLLPILPQSSILSEGPAVPLCSKASRSSDLRIKHGPLPDPLKSPPWLLSPPFSSPSPAQESFYPLAQGPLSVLWRPECPALRTMPTADAQVSIVDGRKEGRPAQAPHFLPCAWRGPYPLLHHHQPTCNVISHPQVYLIIYVSILPERLRAPKIDICFFHKLTN